MRSSSFIVLFLSFLVLCVVSPFLVSADGAIQPFIDQYCDSAVANATLIPVVSAPGCQWMTINDMAVSFSYQCNAYANFSLAFYVNSSVYCGGEPDWSITSTSLSSSCSVATYDDPSNHVLFYASVSCSANWPAHPQLEDGVDKLQNVERNNVQRAHGLPQQLNLTELSNALPNVKDSALQRMMHLIQQHKKQ